MASRIVFPLVVGASALALGILSGLFSSAILDPKIMAEPNVIREQNRTLIELFFNYHSRGITQNSTLFIALAVGMFAILSILSTQVPDSRAWWLLASIYLLISIPGGLFLVYKLGVSVIKSHKYAESVGLTEMETETSLDPILRAPIPWLVFGMVWIAVSILALWAVYHLARSKHDTTTENTVQSSDGGSVGSESPSLGELPLSSL